MYCTKYSKLQCSEYVVILYVLLKPWLFEMNPRNQTTCFTEALFRGLSNKHRTLVWSIKTPFTRGSPTSQPHPTSNASSFSSPLSIYLPVSYSLNFAQQRTNLVLLKGVERQLKLPILYRGAQIKRPSGLKKFLSTSISLVHTKRLLLLLFLNSLIPFQLQVRSSDTALWMDSGNSSNILFFPHCNTTLV